MMRLRQSETTATKIRIPIFLVDDTDGKTPEPSVTPASGELRVMKNGGSWANAAGTWSNRGEGAYDYTPTASELDTTGYLMVKVLVSGIRIFVALAQVATDDPYLFRNLRGLVATNAGNTALTFQTNLSSSTSDAYKAPMLVRFLTGALAGQTRPLAVSSSYNGTTKFLTVSNAFTITPTSGDEFEIVSV